MDLLGSGLATLGLRTEFTGHDGVDVSIAEVLHDAELAHAHRFRSVS